MLNNSRGGVTTIKKAVCLHEEDAGMAWKHLEYRNGHAEVRRARRLVISFISTIANYEYGEHAGGSWEGAGEAGEARRAWEGQCFAMHARTSAHARGASSRCCSSSLKHACDHPPPPFPFPPPPAGFYWSLYQDGTIGFEAKLTGIVSTHAMFPDEQTPEGGSPEWGTRIAPGVNAHVHQHFFMVRMDPTVDCAEGGKNLQVGGWRGRGVGLGEGGAAGGCWK